MIQNLDLLCQKLAFEFENDDFHSNMLMFRSKFWLKMTIFEKTPAKWQFWFEIGVFWRVGILGMVPDLIRKKGTIWNDSGLGLNFESKEITTFGTIHDNDNSWSDWWP